MDELRLSRCYPRSGSAPGAAPGWSAATHGTPAAKSHLRVCSRTPTSTAVGNQMKFTEKVIKRRGIHKVTWQTGSRSNRQVRVVPAIVEGVAQADHSISSIDHGALFVAARGLSRWLVLGFDSSDPAVRGAPDHCAGSSVRERGRWIDRVNRCRGGLRCTLPLMRWL